MQIEKGKQKRTSRGAFAKLTTERRGRPRITPQPPLRVTLDDTEQGDIVDHLHRRLPAHAPGGPPETVRPLHPRRRRAPGGWGGQRRHGGVPGVVRGQRPWRPAFPPVQAGRPVGLRGLHVPERSRQPRRPGHRRQADGAERHGHLRRLGLAGRPRLLRAPVPRHEADPDHRPHRTGSRPVRHRVRELAGPGARPLRRPGGHRCLHGEERRVHQGHADGSPAATPTRTSGTTPGCVSAIAKGAVEGDPD